MDKRQKKSVQYWLESSEDDWKVANHLFEKGDYSYSLFFGHLTIEKISKVSNQDQGDEGMAIATDSIIEVVKRYIEEVKKNGIKIREAIIFGSFVKGTAKEWSDIDIALVSPDFTGDRFEDRRRIIPMRRKFDSRIEPIPFRPKDFYDGGMLVEEIKRTGVSLDLS